MVAAGALLLLVTAASPGTPAAPGSYSTPTLGALVDLRQWHRPGQWLRVTSGTARYTFRAQMLDEQGLFGITAPKGRAAPPDPFPWARIERIDIETNRKTYGTIMGAVVGGIGGLVFPAIPHGYTTDGSMSLSSWFLGGALVGAIGGRAIGGNVVRERALYVAQVAAAAPVVAEAPPPAAAPDSARGTSPDVHATTGADTTATTVVQAPPAPSTADHGPPDPLVERAVRRISSGNLLRIDGSFGRFQGYASRAGAGGLSGLRADSRFESVAGLRTLTWSQIERIDMQTSSAGGGAIRGAVVVGTAAGVLGALLGLALDSLGGGGYGVSAALAGGAIGIGAGGAVGALLGGAIGAGVPSWHNVYQRP